MYQSRAMQFREARFFTDPVLLEQPPSGYWGHELWTDVREETVDGQTTYRHDGELVYRKGWDLARGSFEEEGTYPSTPGHWLFSYKSLVFPPDAFPAYR